MGSMDFNYGIEDVGVAFLQELWNRVAIQAVDLASESRDVVLGKGSFQDFSRSVNELNTLFHALDARKIESAMGLESTKSVLETLNDQLGKACKIIKNCKSGSRFYLLLRSNSVLSEMQDLSREIATTVSSFQLVNLNMTLNLRTMMNQIVDSLRSLEFHSAAATERISMEIENSISQNERNRENAVSLLEKIAEAVGASANASLVENELAILKQEKEEMDAQKKQAEALQLDQLIQLLYRTELVTRPQSEEVQIYHQQFPIESIICPLCNEVMTDPVAIVCGHSFERKAIQEHFKRGEKKCPTCREELQSLYLMPNLNLRNSIEDWKQREMDLKFEASIVGINSNDHSEQKKALEDMQSLMEMPRYAAKTAEEFVPRLVEFLKDNRLNAKATLKCLYGLAKFSDDHKEAIVQAGAIRHTMKQIYKGDTEADALAVLLELSKRESLAEKIGKTKDCIPILVSFLHKDDPNVSENAHSVLQNLSSNTHFVVKMAEAGYYQPFVACFNKGSLETRSLMAAALTNMQLKENGIAVLKERQFIHNIIQLLSSNSPASKSACLKCINKFIAYPRMLKRLLSDPVTIPHLLGLISFVRSDPQLKQQAAEILARMVGDCQQSQFQLFQGLQELQSQHNVSLFLQLVASSESQLKIQFLHLLVELSYKSEKARDLIQSNDEAVTQLFSSLDGEQPAVRRWALKLLHCISEGHPNGVPLPSSPGKETAINTLAAILTSSLDIEERSTAAGIISRLPKHDIVVDEVLRKSDVLKAIHEVISSMDGELGVRIPKGQDECLLENALAALLHFTEPSKPELQRQVGKLQLYPSLIRVLSSGSSMAKQRAATAFAQLSQSTSLSISDATRISTETKTSMPMLLLNKLLPGMSLCCSDSSEHRSLCSVHGAACSPRETFCLVKADAVKPLLKTLSDIESGVAEAALMALETLLIDHSTLSPATAVIVDSQGVTAILQVLEKGSLSAKAKALDLFQKILKHTQLEATDPLFMKSERILIQLLDDDSLKKKVGLVLRQMNIIPDQSSYF